MTESTAPANPLSVHLHALKIDSKSVYLDGMELGGVAALSYDESEPHGYGFLTIKLYIDRSHLELDLPPRFDPASSNIKLVRDTE